MLNVMIRSGALGVRRPETSRWFLMLGSLGAVIPVVVYALRSDRLPVRTMAAGALIGLMLAIWFLVRRHVDRRRSESVSSAHVEPASRSLELVRGGAAADSETRARPARQEHLPGWRGVHDDDWCAERSDPHTGTARNF